MQDIELLASGFGGQGIMVIGELVASSAVKENKFATFLPSYGPAMRGGTANCIVFTSEKEIGSPVFSEHQNVIVMNLPSFDKFENAIQKGGNFIINSSLIDKKSSRTDINVHYIPANDLSTQAGANVSANIVILGSFLKLTKFAEYVTVENEIKERFEIKGEKVIDINLKALKLGYDYL
jgi:2-oxoglutarate ferredoxin oxidoreductase subunit gamma